MSDEAAHASPIPHLPKGDGRFRLGNWIVDPSADEISRDGQIEKLEPRKMRLLVVLARRAGEVVTAEELLDAV